MQTIPGTNDKRSLHRMVSFPVTARRCCGIPACSTFLCSILSLLFPSAVSLPSHNHHCRNSGNGSHGWSWLRQRQQFVDRAHVFKKNVTLFLIFQTEDRLKQVVHCLCSNLLAHGIVLLLLYSHCNSKVIQHFCITLYMPHFTTLKY